MMLTPQTELAVAQALLSLKAGIDRLKAERDSLRTAYADLWRAVKRIEADSRLGLGQGLEVASSALHYVHTYASSAIRAAEKKGFAPAIGENKP
jgi:hypothetical protein